MRIIAGEWRGRPLVAPKGDATRPTADRLREALFSMLTSRIGSFEGLAVADMFAGSGALGFEALSRGAASCLFVDQDRAAVDAIQANGERLGVRPDVRQTSVLSLGPAPAPLDLLLMDPPYGTGAGAVALDRLARLGWVGPATWISIETERRESVEVAGFAIDVSRAFGKARLTLMRSAGQCGSSPDDVTPDLIRGPAS
jgi:16S rRNA (guanine966-N2)-methyltransferase